MVGKIRIVFVIWMDGWMGDGMCGKRWDALDEAELLIERRKSW